MALSRYKLGELVVPHSEKCGIANLTPYQVSGVNREKEFFEPSHQVGEDTSKYQVVPPKYFACNLMHVGRDCVLPVAWNHSGNVKYVSPAYTVFSLKQNCGVLEEYLFMLLKSEEKDRYFWFHADASVRDGMSWQNFCDVEICVPDLSTQQKYVDIYKAMVANQQCYERGLEDLKLVCEAHFDKSKKEHTMPLGLLIESVDLRNCDNLHTATDVKGITNNKEFSETKADISSVDLSKFKVVYPGQFAYNSRTDGRDMLVLALNRETKPVIVTFNYNVFQIRPFMRDAFSSEYLYSYFKRAEFDRRVRFSSWGSSQELLSWDNLCDIRVPVPSIQIQQTISEIMNACVVRKEINEQLKSQIRNICPILIRGSLEEGK